MRALILAGMMALTVPAAASEYRTVTWYANHPTIMRGVVKLCRDNAGLAAKNPNCTNAEEAGTMVVQEELNRHGGNPYRPEYWEKRPLEMKQQLFTCNAIARQAVRMDRATAGMCGAVQIAMRK